MSVPFDEGIPLWMYIVPICLIILFLIIIFIVIYLIRRENHKRWKKQELGYHRWRFENYSVKQAVEIIDRLNEEGRFKEAQRFIHEIMKVHKIRPGTYSWFYYRHNYALAKFNRYIGKNRKKKKVKEAISIWKELQYDPFVISDPEASIQIQEQLKNSSRFIKEEV